MCRYHCVSFMEITPWDRAYRSEHKCLNCYLNQLFFVYYGLPRSNSIKTLHTHIYLNRQLKRLRRCVYRTYKLHRNNQVPTYVFHSHKFEWSVAFVVMHTTMVKKDDFTWCKQSTTILSFMWSACQKYVEIAKKKPWPSLIPQIYSLMGNPVLRYTKRKSKREWVKR